MSRPVYPPLTKRYAPGTRHYRRVVVAILGRHASNGLEGELATALRGYAGDGSIEPVDAPASLLLRAADALDEYAPSSPPGMRHCGFCCADKPAAVVIRGPRVGICHDCVRLCEEIIPRAVSNGR